MNSINGKIIISTRPYSENDSLAGYHKKQGAEVINFPMTEITHTAESLEKEKNFSNINQFDHIIFTSKNGVKYFFDQAVKFQFFANIPASVNFSVIGTRTAYELSKYNFNNIYIAKGNTSKDFLEELINQEEIKYQNILLVLGNLAADTLEKGLYKIAKITRLNIYKTQPVKIAALKVMEQIRNNRYDMIVFTSPAGIENFIRIMREAGYNNHFRIACIGKTTAQKALENNIIPVLTASVPEGEILAKEFKKYLLTH
jgi:uroporphyrinogen-III synthase